MLLQLLTLLISLYSFTLESHNVGKGFYCIFTVGQNAARITNETSTATHNSSPWKPPTPTENSADQQLLSSVVCTHNFPQQHTPRTAHVCS